MTTMELNLTRQIPEPRELARHWVVNDQTGDAREIGQDEWPDYQARGYRLAPAGSPAQAFGQAITPLDPTARDLWPREAIERNGGGQLHNWSTKLHYARRALDDAAEKVAGRIARPHIPLNSQGNHTDLPLSIHHAVDIAHTAAIGEAVVLLAQEVDLLKNQVAALQAQEID